MEQVIHGTVKRNSMMMCVLCLAGVALDFLGAQITRQLGLPLYLDCVGIVVSSAVGGYIPGIIVGFFSNLLNGISERITIYYSLTSVLIAVLSAWFAKRGCFKRATGIMKVILGLAVVGGGIGSVLTWFLFGGSIGNGFTSRLAWSIYDSGLMNGFFAQMFADFLYDFLDKTIEVLLVLGILRLLPEHFKQLFPFYRCLDNCPEKPVSRVGTRGISLQIRVMGMLAGAGIFITLAVTVISVQLYHKSVIEEETKMARGVANAAASTFDPDRVPEYLEKGREAPGYQESEARLASIANSSTNIAYVYVYKIREDGCLVVFDPDPGEGMGYEPGEILPFDQAFREKVPDLLAGREISPTISNETFGWLFTIYRPVLDSQGVCQCYVGVDILMKELSTKEQIFLTKVLSLFLSFFTMILAIGAWMASNAVIRPINDMAAATMAFAENLDEDRETSLKWIRRLQVHTGDEIENLYRAILSNAEETVEYIADVNAKNAQITQMQNGLITVLADLVESRDQCTGNHIKNTAAYVRLILEQLRRDGMWQEVLTDAYIEDVFNSAPLHDIGKIEIPDAVLNKPGKLTNEEFALMKTHSTIGGSIIDMAVSRMAPGSAVYMAEAKNVAKYHHERWDGRGYPAGLKGEETPLSARVMAVADVFDALLSKRSYKEGFPFEKAIGIIREESGTHFDPRVVQAFLEREDEIRAIAENRTHPENQA